AQQGLLRDHVLARTALELVLARAADQGVIALAAEQLVLALAAVHGVLAAQRADQVVAVLGVDLVLPRGANDHVRLLGPGELVRPGAEDRRRLPLAGRRQLEGADVRTVAARRVCDGVDVRWAARAALVATQGGVALVDRGAGRRESLSLSGPAIRGERSELRINAEDVRPGRVRRRTGMLDQAERHVGRRGTRARRRVRTVDV